jgi:hypothetical protein
MHGCPTEEEALGGVTGKLGTHVWEHDHDLKKMVEVGWEWVILPHTLDVKFPKLAELIQHALNTPNSVFGTQSEFELAASIWEVVSSTSSKEVNWDEVSTSCCSGAHTILCQHHWQVCQVVLWYFGFGLIYVIDCNTCPAQASYTR